MCYTIKTLLRDGSFVLTDDEGRKSWSHKHIAAAIRLQLPAWAEAALALFDKESKCFRNLCMLLCYQSRAIAAVRSAAGAHNTLIFVIQSIMFKIGQQVSSTPTTDIPY